LRGGKFGGGYSLTRSYIYRRFARKRQRMHLLRADSHDPSTLDEVRRLIGDNEIDFLFLDGDHTYEGIKKDWEMYAPLVRSGGIIAFHDVAGNYDSTQVKRFWDSIKAGYEHREYIVRSDGLYGVGVIIKQ
jgi:cephalosporin hydroxylase